MLTPFGEGRLNRPSMCKAMSIYAAPFRKSERGASSPPTTLYEITPMSCNSDFGFERSKPQIIVIPAFNLQGIKYVEKVNRECVCNFFYFRIIKVQLVDGKDNVGNNHLSLTNGTATPDFIEPCSESHTCPLSSEKFYNEYSDETLPVYNESVLDRGSGDARNVGDIPQQIHSVQKVTKIGNHPVGGGGFADVWKGRLEDGTLVAIKVLRVFNPEPEFADLNKETIKKEAKIWAQLNHPNILTFIGTSDVFQPQIALISPWMEDGTIIQYVKRNAGANRCKLIWEIAKGVKYLHDSEPSVVHGDLRANNILIDGEGNPKIADFGLARVMECNSTVVQSSYKAHGHFRWQAPELLNPDIYRGQGEEGSFISGHTKKTDVYAFASVCLEVFTERIPYAELPEAQALMEIAIHLRHPSRPSQLTLERGLTDDIWDLMQMCWSKTPSERPDINQIVNRLEV